MKQINAAWLEWKRHYSSCGHCGHERMRKYPIDFCDEGKELRLKYFVEIRKEKEADQERRP